MEKEEKKNSTVHAQVEIDPMRIKTPEIQLELAGKGKGDQGEPGKPGDAGKDGRDGRDAGLGSYIVAGLALLAVILFLIGWGGGKKTEPVQAPTAPATAPATPAPTHKWNETTNRLEPLSFLFSLFVGTAEAQTVDGATTANMLAAIEGLRVKNAGLEKALTNGTCDKAAEACTNSFKSISSKVGELRGQVDGLPSATATKLLPELQKLEASLQSVGVKLDELKKEVSKVDDSVKTGFENLKKEYGADWKAAAAQPKSEFCTRLLEIGGKGVITLLDSFPAEMNNVLLHCLAPLAKIVDNKRLYSTMAERGGMLKGDGLKLFINSPIPASYSGPDWPYWAVLPACGVAAAGGWGVSYAQGFSSQTQGITAGISCVVAGGFSFLLSILTD